MFSAIIPTLRNPPELEKLVELLEGHRDVDEIIVINNGSSSLNFGGSKLQVLQQRQNIFVNPAWNLGAAVATASHLLIINDDVVVPESLVSFMAFFHRHVKAGVLAPARSAFRTGSARVPFATPIFRRSWGFGVMMSVAKKNWQPIPDGLNVFFGDDWLFHSQRDLNFAVHGYPIATEMSTTSGAPEFAAMLESERIVFERVRPSTYWDSTRLIRIPMRAKERLLG